MGEASAKNKTRQAIFQGQENSSRWKLYGKDLACASLTTPLRKPSYIDNTIQTQGVPNRFVCLEYIPIQHIPAQKESGNNSERVRVICS
jgi:hypothetical protein